MKKFLLSTILLFIMYPMFTQTSVYGTVETKTWKTGIRPTTYSSTSKIKIQEQKNVIASYIIIQSLTTEKLLKDVEYYLNKGYTPQGGICCYVQAYIPYFMQAMVK